MEPITSVKPTFDFSYDSKVKFYIDNHKIGLDIDEVLADFIGGYLSYMNVGEGVSLRNWSFSYKFPEIFKGICQDKEFWLGLQPLVTHTDLPFIPTCYISKRSNIPVAWTEEWIEKNHLPCVDVIHVDDDKVEAFKSKNLDYFIDDSIKNFARLNSAGCKTFLMDASHNRQFDVGNYRIFTVADLIYKI